MAIEQLRRNDMMAHLLNALERRQDIGHYGRLVFVMVARHFLSEDELVAELCKDPACPEERARALVRQVETREYSPPRREKIRQFQAEQDFPICPTDDPDGCNLYKDLKFPDEVYRKIGDYYEQKAEAQRT